MYFRFARHHVDISGRDVTELYTAAALGVMDNVPKCMAVSLRVLETQGQKWTGGYFSLPTSRDKG